MIWVPFLRYSHHGKSGSFVDCLGLGDERIFYSHRIRIGFNAQHDDRIQGGALYGRGYLLDQYGRYAKGDA